jgi:hypothetical protein
MTPHFTAGRGFGPQRGPPCSVSGPRPGRGPGTEAVRAEGEDGGEKPRPGGLSPNESPFWPGAPQRERGA